MLAEPGTCPCDILEERKDQPLTTKSATEARAGASAGQEQTQTLTEDQRLMKERLASEG